MGMAGRAVADCRVVTLGESGTKQQVWALDFASGKTLWKTDVAAAYRNGMGNGARATPTIAGGRVVVFTGEGRLLALDAKTGKVSWQQDVITSLKGRVADYGMACSPLVVGDLVVVTPGAPRAAVAAYNLSDGESAWTAGSGSAGSPSAWRRRRAH